MLLYTKYLNVEKIQAFGFENKADQTIGYPCLNNGLRLWQESIDLFTPQILPRTIWPVWDVLLNFKD